MRKNFHTRSPALLAELYAALAKHYRDAGRYDLEKQARAVSSGYLTAAQALTF